MKKLQYSVAMSLDGFIAGPNGEYVWIVMDPDIDFQEIQDRCDVILMGRGTHEITHAQGGGAMNGIQTYVVSTTLKRSECPGVTIVSEDVARFVAELKALPGKDIWLFGGGVLFRSLLDLDLVDSVSVAIIPTLLGSGIRMLPHWKKRTVLALNGHQVLEKTGTVLLEYSVTST